MKYPRVPIPLLYYHNVARDPKGKRRIRARSGKKENKVFFRGRCAWGESKVRELIGEGKVLSPGKLPGGRVEWDVQACNKHIMPRPEYVESMYNSTWVLAPTGSMPSSYRLYEGLQAGALGIVPYDEAAGLDEAFLWLPYRDIGLRWQHELVELFPMSKVDDIKKTIENITQESIRKRQLWLDKMESLFRADGLFAYILYMVRKASAATTTSELRTDKAVSLAHATFLWSSLAERTESIASLKA
eukprot:gnl/TRDRNA2_/TRDRNA2_85252_c0_seq1.p1 gnl/TRDRNA2_/TRDRNA2_85252_c0~~gnl/TRDRNA2_/TRDRNA2_85252_c0_seq1.p1  ORF type:complete len:283 (-),score=33.29 gnl/TRDRNA2_/TRDRNA2_85252_c0_seq1:96-827(-)